MNRVSQQPLLTFVAALVMAAASATPGQHVHTSRPEARRLPLPKSADVWHFAVYGDRTGGPAIGIEVLKQAVQDTNLLDPDLVMTVGDLVQGYNEPPQWERQVREYHSVMSGLRMPWYPVAGNHDIYWRPNPGSPPAPPEQHERHYEEQFGPLWYWFGHKNAAFIVLFSDERDERLGTRDYNLPEGQRFSPEQVAWLDRTLEQTRGYDHVFLFLHHPRWISDRYRFSDWRDIEQKLILADNVTAVFAGHVHQMHFAQVDRGSGQRPLQYFTLATTGGSKRTQLPEAGYLHHLDVVTVRTERITVATLPVGSVIDPKSITDDRRAALDALLDRPPLVVGSSLSLAQDGSLDGYVRCLISNPSPRPVEVSLFPDDGGGGMAFFPDHLHTALPPHGSREVVFHCKRPPGPLLRSEHPKLIEDMDWLSDIRVSMPTRTHTLSLGVGEYAALPSAAPGVLHLADGGCVAVPAERVPLPDGPFTLEAWVWAEAFRERQPLITKTEQSEYGFFASRGRAEFMVHLDDKYFRATMPAGTQLMPHRWYHLAGVFDGQEVRLFVDGTLVAQSPAQGRRKVNDLPLYLGADPDRNGSPVDFLEGRLDAVRLSSVDRYRGDFTPSRVHVADEHTVLWFPLDGDLGPFVPDMSGHRRHGERQGRARTEADLPTKPDIPVGPHR